MVFYIKQRGELQEEQQSHTKLSLFSESTPANFSCAHFENDMKTSLYANSIQKVFLAENTYCIFLYMRVFAFVCFMLLVSTRGNFIASVYFIVLSDFSSILHVGFF